MNNSTFVLPNEAKRRTAAFAESLYQLQISYCSGTNGCKGSPELTRSGNSLLEEIEKCHKKTESDVLGAVESITCTLNDFLEEYCEAIHPASEMAEELQNRIESIITKMMNQGPWLALIPLECRFNSFPELTRIGDYYIINPTRMDTDVKQRCDKAMTLLRGIYKDIATPLGSLQDSPSIVLSNFLDLEIVGEPRATLCLLLKRGNRRGNGILANRLFGSFLRLLRFTQVLYQYHYHDPRTLKLEHLEYFGISCGLLSDIGSGTSEGFKLELEMPVYENRKDPDYDYGFFMGMWADHVQKYYELRKRLPENEIVMRLDNAIEVMSLCRYEEFADVALSSVIASETILTINNNGSNLSERFAMFGAKLLQTDLQNTRNAFKELKALYNYRSKLVHESRRIDVKGHLFDFGREDVGGYNLTHPEIRQKSFCYFVTFFVAIVAWLDKYVGTNPSPSKQQLSDAFDEFYAETLFGN